MRECETVNNNSYAMPRNLPITHKLLHSLCNVGNTRASISGTACSPALAVIASDNLDYDGHEQKKQI